MANNRAVTMELVSETMILYCVVIPRFLTGHRRDLDVMSWQMLLPQFRTMIIFELGEARPRMR